MVDEIIIRAGQIAAALGAISALLGLFIKWAIIKPIKLYIDQATAPIQPTANGGKSLPDAISAIHQVNAAVIQVERKVENVSKRVEKLEKKIQG